MDEQKRRIALDFLAGKISADDLKRAATAPPFNPIAFVSAPINPDGELCDDDTCTFQTSAFAPHFWDGMSYREYLEACRTNMNSDITPATIVFAGD